MTQEEMDKLAQRIANLGSGLRLEDILGALGIVVVKVLRQYGPEESMAATVSWVAVLTNQMLQDYRRSKSN